MTDLLFNQDSYLKETEASIIGVEENIIQLRISLANVEPIKIPSNWKADIDINGVIITNPHNPNVKSLNMLISVKIEIR